MAVKGLNRVGKPIKGANVLIMGLTYKEDVADIRESPVEEMVEELKEFETVVYWYDPLLPESVIEHFGAIPLQRLDKPMDAVIVSVAHASFRDMTAAEIGKLMPERPVLVDVRGILDPAEAQNVGIEYRRL